MTETAASLPDPTPAIAERQLAMLTELAEMAMAASRAFTTSAIAASKAEAMILGEEWFTPEVGRARACGARDAAESLQKVSRAVRLTLKLEMTVAEIVRDIRAGKITYIGGLAAGKDAGGTPAYQDVLLVRRRPAGSSRADTPDRERLDREPRDSESLVEFDRPDRFPLAAFSRVAPRQRCRRGRRRSGGQIALSQPERRRPRQLLLCRRYGPAPVRRQPGTRASALTQLCGKPALPPPRFVDFAPPSP